MKPNLTAIIIAVGLTTASAAAPAAKNWTPPATPILAQALSDQTMRDHPDLVSVTFHGVPPGMSDTYTMFAGSYPERIGNPDDPDDIDVIKKGITIIDPRWHRPRDAVKRTVVQMPLRDAHGENVGLIVYAFKIEPKISEVEAFAKASAMRDALEPRIPTYDALFAAASAAAPLSATGQAEDTAPRASGDQTYARHLARAARAAHPDVAAVVIKTGSSDKLSVVGADPLGAKAAGVAVPLKNVSGDTIGEILIVHTGAGDHSASDRALQHYIAARSLSAKNLGDPWPYDATHRPDMYAQKLVDQTMRAHAELLVFAIHATPPGERVNIIAGSNIGRIGKAADEDDARVIDKGQTNLEVAEGGERFEVELPLNDASGKRIGALGTVFAYHAGADKAALQARAIAIRNALAKEIPTSAALFRPAR